MKRSTPLKPGKPLRANPETTRAWMERSRKPLSPTSPPKRSVGVRRVNAKRRKKRKDEGKVYGDYHRWMESHPCILAGLHRCIPPVKGHHLERVGNGGEDIGNEVPACVQAHDELHWSEDKVEQRYGVNLDAIAAEYERRWRDA